MEKLKITLVSQGPDASVRLKIMSYAPFALKAYLDFHLSEPLRDKAKIKVLDFKWDTPPEEMASQILVDEPDIVGFSVYIWNYNQIFECVRNIKTAKKDTLIILGGPQVSPIAQGVMLENSCVDIISFVPASGEITLLDIVEAVFYKRDFSAINGICYYDANRNIVKTSPHVKPLDYETTPSPYLQDNGVFDEDTEYMAIIETARGCPYDCGYCFWGNGKRKIEYFPLMRALRDIQVVYSNPKVKHVYFSDSNLLSNPERVETIIKHILNQKRQVRTDLEINSIYLKESTAKLMARLPDFQFITAIQSANPKALKCIGKLRPSLEMFTKKLEELKTWVPGARHQFDLLLGLPGDDLSGFIQTLDFVLSYEPFYMVVGYPVYLLPGSRFFENRQALGLKYHPEAPFSIIDTPTFPQKDINQALKIAIWAQILMFYYPVIAKFFYVLVKLDKIRIQRLLRWIRALEEKIDLFASYGDLTEVATKSVSEWNKVKKDLLEKASTTKSAQIIYSTIRDLEKSIIDSPLGEVINLGCDVFDYMRSQGMDSVEFSDFEQLPDNITKGYQAEEISSVFSRYRL